MKRLLIALCCVAGVSSATRSQGAPPDGIDNVVAFARLYGVVRYFYPADAATAVDWNGFAVLGVSRVRPAPDAAALGAALERLFVPLGPGIAIGPSLPPAPAIGAPDDSLVAWRYLGAAVGQRPGVYRAERTNRPPPVATAPSGSRVDVDVIASNAVPVTGDHVDVELARGLRARVSLALSNEDAARRPDAAALSGLLAAAARVLPTRDADPDTNLADVVVAWNVFRHFYPYWPDLTRDPQVDWDAQLPRHLRAAAAATTKAQQREVLQRLVADAHDGHGGVTDPLRRRDARRPADPGAADRRPRHRDRQRRAGGAGRCGGDGGRRPAGGALARRSRAPQVGHRAVEDRAGAARHRMREGHDRRRRARRRRTPSIGAARLRATTGEAAAGAAARAAGRALARALVRRPDARDLRADRADAAAPGGGPRRGLRHARLSDRRRRLDPAAPAGRARARSLDARRSHHRAVRPRRQRVRHRLERAAQGAGHRRPAACS